MPILQQKHIFVNGCTNVVKVLYGLCKEAGIDTTGMTPREAWEALEDKTGKTKEQFEKEHWGKTAKDSKKGSDNNLSQGIDKSGEAEYNKKKREKAINEMLNSDRIKVSKTLTKETIKKNLSYGTEEMQETTATAFNNDSYVYENRGREDSCFSPLGNRVHFIEDFTDLTEGDTFYHESWHAIDKNYGQTLNSIGRPKELSESYLLNDGQTLYNKLCNDTSTANWKEIKREIYEKESLLLDKAGYSKEKRDSIIKAYDEKIEELKKLAPQNLGPFEKAQFAIQECEKTKEGQVFVEFKKCKDEKHKEIQKIWSDLSDVYSGYTKDRERLVGYGHSSYYWRHSKPETRANEVFAEIASAKAVNPESYEILKKYLPNTVAGFEEIYEKIKDGRIKPIVKK